MVGELMAQGPLDLPGEEVAIVAEIAFERVPVDDDPVLVLFPRDPIPKVPTTNDSNSSSSGGSGMP
jgi:hypothetical protein